MLGAGRRYTYSVLAGLALAVAGGHAAVAATAPAATARAAATPYTVYWLGPSFQGFKLTDRIRRIEKPEPGERFGADFYSFLYGTCKPASVDGGCTLPAEIQSWAACKRNLSVYSLTPDGTPLPHKSLRIRGVPAAYFEDGARLEIYTGRTTVVIFGSDPTQLSRAAAAMASTDGKIKAGAPLPAPARGALQGKLAC